MRRSRLPWALAVCALLLVPTASAAGAVPAATGATASTTTTATDRGSPSEPSESELDRAEAAKDRDAGRPVRHGDEYWRSRVVVASQPSPEKAAEKKETVQQAEERIDRVARLRAGRGTGTGRINGPLAGEFTDCQNLGETGGGGITLEHMLWCKVTSFRFVSEVCSSQNPLDCKEVGHVDFRLTLAGEGHQGNSTADRTTHVTLGLDRARPSGAPRPTDMLTVAGLCEATVTGSPPCSAQASQASKPLSEWMTDAGGFAWFDFTSPEGSLTGDRLAWYAHSYRFSSPTDSTTVSGTTFRCDSATYLPNKFGCVYKVTEVFDLLVDSEDKDSADLIWTAQHQPDRTFPVTESPRTKSIPGTPSTGALTRTTDTNGDGNRTESVKQCKVYFGEKYTRDSRDCDEYPFASTEQGSKTGGTGTSHYAVKALDKAQNQKAGTRLQVFYGDRRILREEDSFFTHLVNADGSEYKGPKPPSGVAAPVTYRQCPNGDLPEVKDVRTKAPPESQLLDYAKTTPNGWTGGDSTYSVRLPDNRLAFLFSDTFLGPLNADGTRPTSAKLVNSSFVLQDGGSLSTITGGSARNPTGHMPPVVDNRWYWLGDGMIADVGGTKYLQVMFQEYRGTHDGSELPFAYTRSVVATFELTNLTKPVWIDPLPSDSGIAWGSALLPASRSGDGYTYIYGVSNDRVNKKMRIARVHGSDLTRADQWQYLNTAPTGDNWMRADTDANDTLPGVANEYSVTPWHGQFVAISQDSTEAFSNRVRVWSACDPFGPFGFWVGHDEVYRMPETGPYGSYGDPQVFAYNAHAHPTLQSGDRWTVSYNVNSFDNGTTPDSAHYRDPSIYKPRFFSFQLGAAPGVTRSSKQFRLVP